MTVLQASPRTDVDFAAFMGGVAKLVWGEPNKALSTRDELRWGAHGSKSVDLAKGTFFDHEANEGGGVLELLKREAGLDVGPAFDWLRNKGFEVPERQRTAEIVPAKRITATYDYVDEDGEVLFQVVRYHPKDFRQRRPDPSAQDGWSWSIKGVRLIPYRLPDVIEAIALEKLVCIVEGEKDAEALWRRGIPATCNAGGAGKWPEGFAEFFRGAHVLILPDNDEAGRKHRDIVGASLKPVAASVRVLELPLLPPKGDCSDWFDLGNTGESLIALADVVARPWAPAPPASQFGAIRWVDLDQVTTRQDWLVEDLMFAGDAGLVFGASGSGKSFLAVHCGLSVARGVDFLGKKTRQAGVLYQAGEGGKGLVKRLRAYRQENRVVGDVPFVLLPARADFFSPDGDCDAFVLECQAQASSLSAPLGLIIIDTLSTASPGANENASEDMSRLLKFSERLQRETGAAVLWVHHKNAAGDRERGHTSLRANVDTALEVTRDPETNARTLRVAKLKDGEDGEQIGFELQSVTIGTYDDGKPMTSCVVRPAQVDDQRTGKRARLSPGLRLYLMTLADTIIQYGGVLPSGDRIPSNMHGVEYQTFCTVYRATSTEKEDGAIRTALSRDGRSLMADELIGKHERWIWITDKGRAVLRR